MPDCPLVVDENVLVEIVTPGTGIPVEDGEIGEVIVTSLNPDYPLIRFATGDLSAIAPGLSICGRTNTRIIGWRGRADQSAKVKGMFIRPEQVAILRERYSEIKKTRIEVNIKDNKLLYMNGRAVFTFAATQVPKSFNRLLIKANLSIQDIDLVLLHQGSKYIVETLSKRSCLTIDKNEQISTLASLLKKYPLIFVIFFDKLDSATKLLEINIFKEKHSSKINRKNT